MSMTPELRAVLERRIEAVRGAEKGMRKLIDAGIEDPNLSAQLAAVIGEGWISVLVNARGATTAEAVSIEFELRHPSGPDEPKGGGS
jgi:hypothetical protein